MWIVSVYLPLELFVRRCARAGRCATPCALVSRWARPWSGLFIGIAFSGVHVFSQIVERGYVFKYDIYSQAEPAKAVYHGSLLSAGFQFVDPIRIISTSNSLISGPGFISAPALLSASGLEVTTSSHLHPSRAQFSLSIPNGTFRFQFPPVFDASIELTGDRFPTAAVISNYAALQTVSDRSAIVQWSPSSTATAGDSVFVSVSNDRGDELYAVPGVNANGAADENATTATLAVPPGRASFGTVTILRRTATSENPDGRLFAGYATSTTFPIRSVGAPDVVAPQLISQIPELGVVGVAPDASVDLIFDEPMRRRGLLRSASYPNGQEQRLAWSADQRSVRVSFLAPLPRGPFTLTFGSDNNGQAFQDISENPIASGLVAARFFVGNLPVFTLQPASQTPEPGKTVTLTTEAAWPPGGLTYQWFRDGVPIPGAVSPSLTVSDFYLAQSGLYELRATNAHGAVLSALALVAIDAVLYFPRGSIVASMEATFPYVGEPITPGVPLTLTARVDNVPTPRFQWRKNGELIPGATGQTLEFSALRESDSGIYDAVLANAYGTSATRDFVLTVSAGKPLPTYQVTRGEIAIPAGTSAMLSLFAQPAYGFLRGWHFNGKKITQGESIPAFSVQKISPADVGVYRYIVSNGRDSVVAAEYQVSIRASAQAPLITEQPQEIWFTENTVESTAVRVEGAYPITFQWRKSGADLSGITGSSLPVRPNQLDQVGTYTCVVRNDYGSVETRPINVRFWPAHVAPEKPRITEGSWHVVSAGGLLLLESSNDWSPAHPRTFQWQRNGSTIPGQESTLRIYPLRVEDSGAYSVVYSNNYGSSVSEPFDVRVIGPSEPPYLNGPKQMIVTRLGAPVELFSPFIAPGNPRYRWFFDGRDVTAENAKINPTSSFEIASVQAHHAGTWSVEVTTNAGIASAPAAEIIIPPGPPASARLINVSTRAKAGTGGETLIVGFSLSGNSPKRILLRAVGPALKRFYVARAARNPRLLVHRGTELVASNDDWYRQPNIVALVTAQRAAGAYSLSVDEGDAAVVATLEPGAYTVQYLTDASETDAIGLIEAYDLDPGYPASRLTNLSSRMFVGAGEQTAIPGLVVSGSGTKTYLVRAIGPGLAKFGVDGVLSDPHITLIAGGGSSATFSNDNWETAPSPAALVQAAERAGAFALEAGSKDAALLVNLRAGSYTALVSGAGSASGTALVEIYEIP